jgi:hypothetical protein
LKELNRNVRAAARLQPHKPPDRTVSFPIPSPDVKVFDSRYIWAHPKGIPERIMAKPHRKLKKANHGKRPASSKARRLKRKDIRT